MLYNFAINFIVIRQEEATKDRSPGERPYEEYTGVCHELGSYFQEKFQKGYVNFSQKFRKGL